MVDCWSELDQNPRCQRGGVVGDLDMGEVDDGEFAKGERVFGVRDGGNQVYGGEWGVSCSSSKLRGGRLVTIYLLLVNPLHDRIILVLVLAH